MGEEAMSCLGVVFLVCNDALSGNGNSVWSKLHKSLAK